MAKGNTFKCSNCGTEISANDFTLFCPNCKKPLLARFLVLAVAIILLIVVVIYVNSLMHIHDKDLYGYNQTVAISII